MRGQVSYETLRAVALLVREGHAGNATPTPHQAREFARGLVVLCDEVDALREALKTAEEDAALWEERARHLGWSQAPNLP